MNKSKMLRRIGSIGLAAALTASITPLNNPGGLFPPEERASTVERHVSTVTLNNDNVPASPSAGTLSEETISEIGPFGARMGQGLERLLTTGDPQVPTVEERQQLTEAGFDPDNPSASSQSSAPENAPTESSVEPGQATTPDPEPAAPSAEVSVPATPVPATPAPAATPAPDAAPAARTAAAAAEFSLAVDAVPDAAQAAAWQPAGIQGMDVSSHQGNVNWRTAWNQGARFAYAKATEGTTYRNPNFSQQYTGSVGVGMVRGAYHFALPVVGSAAAEANFFVNNGGGWSADGKTLPPLLDIEYNPYPSMGNTCYNLSASQMVNWIREFSNTVLSRTGRVPMIYTTTDWWSTCTGNSAAFSANPLHIANYNQSPGPMPRSWSTYNVWQYSSTGPFVGDSNVWNGDAAALTNFALGNSPGATAIAAKARAVPALGSSTSKVVCGLAAGGCVQNYQNGQIHWTPGTGARATQGAVNALWAGMGWEAGRLGYPTGNLICGLAEGGCLQSFQGGNVYWTPALGATYTTGAIDTAWSGIGRERSALGYPTGAEQCGLTGGGCYQNFQGGQIHYSPATGAHPTWGGIGSRWAALKWEGGRLGYPTSNPVCGLTGNGCYQNFQGGQIHYSPASGSHSTSGAIATAWAASGWEGGRLGYPTSEETCRSNGTCVQYFQGGALEWIPGRGVVRR